MRKPIFALCCVLLLSVPLLAASRSPEEQKAYRAAMEQADQKIADEVKQHSELMKNLEYLTTRIGPRLTGSPEMQQAAQWALERFQQYGVASHLETLEIPHAWYRGADTAEVLSPISRRIPVRSAGWSMATPGEVTAPVVVIASIDDLEAHKGKLKGAIVMRAPSILPGDKDVADNAYDSVEPPRRGVPVRETFALRRRLMDALASEHAAALLYDSGKADALFNMGSFSRYEPSRVPVAFVPHPDYTLLYRLAQAGPVSLKLNLAGTFSPGPVPASVTVAEIPGRLHPEQRVIIGAHLDSWDLGQGALDNGTGATAVLEAARALKSLGWAPDRTLTFILFTGEEEGSAGSDAFLNNHTAEIPNMDGLLILDTGTGRVTSIALEELYETGPLMQEIYRPLQEVFSLDSLSTRYFGASDHVPFLHRGIPAYFCVQAVAHYREAHHSQADTFDLAIPDEANQGAALLAAWAWNLSQMPEPLPHQAENQRE